MHEAEAVEDYIGLLSVAGGYESPLGEHAHPGPAVRAAVLGYPGPFRQQARRGDPCHGVSRLGHKRGRLGATRFLRHGGIGQQLGQAAR